MPEFWETHRRNTQAAWPVHTRGLRALRNRPSVSGQDDHAGFSFINESAEIELERQDGLQRANELRLDPIPLILARSGGGYTHPGEESVGETGTCDLEPKALFRVVPAAEQLRGIACQFTNSGDVAEETVDIAASDPKPRFSAEPTTRDRDADGQKVGRRRIRLILAYREAEVGGHVARPGSEDPMSGNGPDAPPEYANGDVARPVGSEQVLTPPPRHITLASSGK